MTTPTPGDPSLRPTVPPPLPPTGEGLINVDHKGDITVLFLARADKRNAMTPPMLDALRQHVLHFGRHHASREGTALLICGEGRMFCSGFDLKLCLAEPQMCAQLLTGLSAVIAAIASVDAPVAIAATGGAIAGACALLSAADIAVGDREGQYGYPVLKMGLSPAVSVPFLLPAVGGRTARQATLDTALHFGEDAARLGLLTDCVDWPDDVIPRTMKRARALASKPRLAFAETKRWLRELAPMQGPHFSALADAGLASSLATAGSDEMRTRLAAMFTKLA